MNVFTEHRAACMCTVSTRAIAAHAAYGLARDKDALSALAFAQRLAGEIVKKMREAALAPAPRPRRQAA